MQIRVFFAQQYQDTSTRVGDDQGMRARRVEILAPSGNCITTFK